MMQELKNCLRELVMLRLERYSEDLYAYEVESAFYHHKLISRVHILKQSL